MRLGIEDGALVEVEDWLLPGPPFVETGAEALAMLEAIDKAVSVLVAVGLMLTGARVDWAVEVGTELATGVIEVAGVAVKEEFPLDGNTPNGVEPRTDEAGIVGEGETGVTYPERETEGVNELTGKTEPVFEGVRELTGTTEPVLEGVDPMIELTTDDAPEATDDTTLPTTL